MSDRIMTEKLKFLVLSGGMDLVGFAPASRWKEAPFHLLSPKAILKGGCVLGSGNNISEYIPVANYFAMIKSIK